MKKIISIFIVLILTANIFSSVSIISFADSYTENYEYTVNSDNTITISSYTGSAEELVVPSEIDGKSVVSIGKKAFYQNKSIIKITLPDTIKTIDDYAFASTTISECNIYEGLETIGEFVFQFSDIKDIILPESLIDLGSYAFAHTDNLETINIPKNLSSISACCFYQSKIKRIHIPSNIKIVYAGAFQACDYLNELIIDEGLEIICDSAFYECPFVKSIVLPSTLKSIGKRGLVLSSSLKYLFVPQSVTEIGEGGIGYKYNFTYVNPNDPHYSPITGFTIYGYEGSAAQTYAGEYNFNFVNAETAFTNRRLGNSIRVISPGMRFGFSLSKTALDFASVYDMEIGFLYCYSGNEEDLTVENIGKNGVIKKEASNYSVNENDITYNLVFTNIPKSAYETNISVRGYAVINGVVYYSEPITNNLSRLVDTVLSDDEISDSVKNTIRNTFELN